MSRTLTGRIVEGHLAPELDEGLDLRFGETLLENATTLVHRGLLPYARAS